MLMVSRLRATRPSAGAASASGFADKYSARLQNSQKMARGNLLASRMPTDLKKDGNFLTSSLLTT
jgi:hypothetical protein